MMQENLRKLSQCNKSMKAQLFLYKCKDLISITEKKNVQIRDKCGLCDFYDLKKFSLIFAKLTTWKRINTSALKQDSQKNKQSYSGNKISVRKQAQNIQWLAVLQRTERVKWKKLKRRQKTRLRKQFCFLLQSQETPKLNIFITNCRLLLN